MILYIGGYKMELKGESRIPQTKQVNDINSLDDRQTNFTPAFNLPKTARNIRNFKSLGIVGNTSNVPYQKNDAYLFDDNGDCFIFNGWANVIETTTEFKCNIYDGNIDLYKAIDNKKMSDLDLTEITHFRTLETITASILTDLPYKYIIADYNGKVFTAANNLNADYLIPAVKVSWLWDLVFETFGFTYTGTQFEHEDFQDLWLTYPKGTTVGLDVTTPLLDVTSSTAEYTPNQYLTPININTYLLTAGSIGVSSGREYYICPSEGQVKAIYEGFRFENVYIYGGQGQELDIDYVTAQLVVENRRTNEMYTINHNTSLFIPVEKDDELYFYVSTPYIFSKGGYPDDVIGDGQFKLELYEGEKIDFKKAFENLSIKEFLNEVVWLFCFIMFKDKYTNNYDFLTFQEYILSDNVVDWSDKFDKQTSEKYTFGNYAKLNFMRHKYNADNANYNDAAFAIENENIKDSTNVISSKFYTTEFEKEIELDGKKLNKYKLWNKEVKEGIPPVISYKALDNRFYFIKYTDIELEDSVIIESESLSTSETFTSLPFERNTGLTFKEIKNKSYLKLGYILNKTKLTGVDFFLKNKDVVNIDFRKKVYIKQLGGQFMLNKINNFMPGKVGKTELLKINQSDIIDAEVGGGDGETGPTLIIHDVVLESNVPNNYNLDITDELYLDVILAPDEAIDHIEVLGYSGGLFTTGPGDDIAQGGNLIYYGDVLTIHTLNIDNDYDIATNPREFMYVFKVFVQNTTTLVVTQKYTIVKNFTINYTEGWGVVLSFNRFSLFEDITDALKVTAPLRPDEEYSHIMPSEFSPVGDPSEFLSENTAALQLSVDAFFVNTLGVNPRKLTGTYLAPSGYGLGLRYDLYAYNTATTTYRLIHADVEAQITLI